MADNPSYSLALLSEYTHTLDSLPIDLSRNFADLRELDAVLSSSVSSITTKIHTLTSMIEEGRASKEDRLWLLTEIAEEAQRLKLGGEDKIRVACQAADNLKAHSSHLRALTDQLPAFDSSVLDRTTVYPHVSERSYMPATTMETGRRRRGVLGSIMTNPDPSPAKRKRAPKDDDGDVGGSYRTPKKPATDNHGRARNNARVKKTDRAASPSDSLVSVTSHLPHHGRNGSHAVSHPRAGGSGAGNNATNSSGAGTTANKRRTNGNNNASHNTTSSTNRVPTPLANETYPSHDTHHTSSRRGGGGGGGGASNEYSVPPSASHPSLPAPYQNGSHGGNGGYDVLGVPLQDWNIPRGAQGLEGPGMPVARSASIHSTGLGAVGGAGGGAGGGGAGSTAGGGSVVDAGADGGDGDGDGDDRTYCFCDGVSYGEMIACDDARCEREWFHLACIGLTVPPEGTWYCEACKSKKPAKRAVRGGKRRTGGTKN